MRSYTEFFAVVGEGDVEQGYVLEKDLERARETHVPERRGYRYAVGFGHGAVSYLFSRLSRIGANILLVRDSGRMQASITTSFFMWRGVCFYSAYSGTAPRVFFAASSHRRFPSNSASGFLRFISFRKRFISFRLFFASL